MSVVDFRLDPAKKAFVRVSETETTADDLRLELQAAADEAQNRLNAATSNKEQTAANVVAAQDADVAADAEVTAAENGVKSSSTQLSDLDAAVAVLAELAGATPEAENAGDTGESQPDTDTPVDETAEATESEEVAIPVTVATDAPA